MNGYLSRHKSRILNALASLKEIALVKTLTHKNELKAPDNVAQRHL